MAESTRSSEKYQTNKPMCVWQAVLGNIPRENGGVGKRCNETNVTESRSRKFDDFVKVIWKLTEKKKTFLDRWPFLCSYMETKSFTQSILIHGTPDAINDALLDIPELSRGNPLVIDVKHIKDEIYPDGVVKHVYNIEDVVPVGPFQVKVTYTGISYLDQNGHVVNEALQSPCIHLTNTYTLSHQNTPEQIGLLPDAMKNYIKNSNPPGILLTEHTEVRAPLLLAGIAISQAQPAHMEMLEKVKLKVESQNQFPFSPASAKKVK